MTTPPQRVELDCPGCGHHYGDWWRPSINLDLDDFDEDEIREATTATCPACQLCVELASLIVDGRAWRVT